MATRQQYSLEANGYWDEQYFTQGYKVVHNAGTEEKTFNLAKREIDLFLWPTEEKIQNLLQDKENNPYPTFDKGFAANHLPLTKNLSNKIALDYGCGILGRYTFALAEYFKTVYGIDISLAAIYGANQLKETLESRNTIFQANDGLSIKLPNNFVDFIFSNLVLQHIGYKEGIFAILKEFARIAKPGGQMRLEFLSSQHVRSSEFFSVVEGCGMNIEEIKEEFMKYGVVVESHSEDFNYLWVTARKS